MKYVFLIQGIYSISNETLPQKFLIVLCFFTRNSVRLAIRKVQFAQDKSGPQPTAEIKKDFLMSDKPLCLEATLDKGVSCENI